MYMYNTLKSCLPFLKGEEKKERYVLRNDSTRNDSTCQQHEKQQKWSKGKQPAVTVLYF